MSKRTFEPVTFTVSVLNADRQTFRQVATFVAQSKDEEASVERAAYHRAATECEAAWPGLCVYRYGDLETGDYNGQFQWKDGGWGGYVPASVHVHDPQAIARAEAEAKKRRAAEAKKAAEIDALPPMTITDAALWQKCLDNNQDGYGAAVNRYAERWAKLMEVEIRKAEDRYRAETDGVLDNTGSMEREAFWRGAAIAVIHDCADRTSHEADTDGITGFMYGAAVATLVGVWQYGDILKTWHNRQYGKPDAEGVVNPALLTIGIEKDGS